MANKQKRAIQLRRQQQNNALFRKNLDKNKEIRRMSKNPLKVIELAYTRQLERNEAFSPVINLLIGYLIPTKRNKKEAVLFYEFLQIFITKKISKKFFEEVENITALYAVANAKKHWIRDLTDWQPLKTRQVKRQFSHLLRFLFAQYNVPLFMDCGFFNNNRTHIYWFTWIASGYNIRKAQSIPFPMTKKMAHYFLQAPNGCSISEALRWGQVLGMGGDTVLAKNLVATKLGNITPQESFWQTIIAFFIKHPMLDHAQIAPIIDYILHQKFEHTRVYNNGVYINEPPPNPNWNIKGRTVTSLLRAMNEWHRQVNTIGRYSKDTVWNPYTHVKDFTFKEGTEHNYKTYRIQQIVNYEVLRDEGRKMRHCVASYVHSCIKGTCSIWSLSVEDKDGHVQKLITIELNRNKTIVQARGKYNALPKPKDQQIIQRWCTMEGLRISKWLGF